VFFKVGDVLAVKERRFTSSGVKLVKSANYVVIDLSYDGKTYQILEVAYVDEYGYKKTARVFNDAFKLALKEDDYNVF